MPRIQSSGVGSFACFGRERTGEPEVTKNELPGQPYEYGPIAALAPSLPLHFALPNAI